MRIEQTCRSSGQRLVEAVSVQHRIGEVLQAEVVDAEESGIVQTVDSAIRSKQ